MDDADVILRDFEVGIFVAEIHGAPKPAKSALPSALVPPYYPDIIRSTRVTTSIGSSVPVKGLDWISPHPGACVIAISDVHLRAQVTSFRSSKKQAECSSQPAPVEHLACTTE